MSLNFYDLDMSLNVKKSCFVRISFMFFTLAVVTVLSASGHNYSCINAGHYANKIFNYSSAQLTCFVGVLWIKQINP
jgi:hypothetical protein